MRPYCTGEGELQRLRNMVHVRGRGGSAPARGKRCRAGRRPRGTPVFPSRTCSVACQLFATEPRFQLSLLPAELPRACGKGSLG